MVWKDGSQYSGQWRDGLREGSGTCMYKSGIRCLFFHPRCFQSASLRKDEIHKEKQ